MPTVLRAVLAQVDGTVTNEYLGIYHPAALRAQTPCELIKDMMANRLSDRDSQFLLLFTP